MPSDQDTRALADLKIGFCDESTATWTDAARAIGRQALDDPEALAFIQRQLAEAPTATHKQSLQPGHRTSGLNVATDRGPIGNVHRFRHACCALASYLSDEQADPRPFRAELDEYIRQPLVAMCLETLQEDGGSVRDLADIPGVTDTFAQWRAGQIASRHKTIAKFQDGGNPRALEANQQALADLESLGETSPIPSGFKPSWDSGAALRRRRHRSALAPPPDL